MLSRRDNLPGEPEIQRLQAMLEVSAAGSDLLDAELARTFYPKRKLLNKNGHICWRDETIDGPVFEEVPRFTRSLDAELPLERTHKIEMSQSRTTRWIASCDGMAEADAATEPLARRLLALKLISLSRRKSSRLRVVNVDTLPANTDKKAPDTDVPGTEDPRDRMILEMAETIKQLALGSKVSEADPSEIGPTTPREKHAAPRSPQQLADNIPLLTGLAEEWVADKVPSKDVERLLLKTVRRFVEVNGDMPVNEIKKVHVRDYLIRLRECPKSLPRRHKGGTLAAAIAYGKQHPEIPKLAVSTINANCTYLRLILNWAFFRDYVQFNAASGLHVKDTRPRAEKRLPYTIDDLKMLFGESALYTGHMPVIRTQPGPHVYRDARFWLPLLALYTGARLGELMNLSPGDLRRENRIDYFDITKGATITRVKSRASERRIPVHPELIRIGVTGFFEQKRLAGERYVFTDIGRVTDDGLKAVSWHEKWRRINRQAGCEHRKKTFHSLRHSFKDACRAADVPEEVHDALTGHITSSIGRRYGSGFPLSVLAKYVNSLSYPGLDLSHLYPKGSDHV